MGQFKAVLLVLTTVVFWLRLSLAMVGFIVAIFWLIVLRILRTTPAYSRQSFGRAMSRCMCPPLGIRVRVQGWEYLEQASPCIYVANHQSYVDYPIAGTVFPGNAAVLARQVGHMPVLGALFRSTENISVDRDNPTRATHALEVAEAAISQRRSSIWIFPEGTRGKVMGKMGPFKRGAFRLAMATGVPLVPVVISPLKPNTDIRARRLRRHQVDIRILPPISANAFPEGGESELRDHVQRVMQEVLDHDMMARVR